MAPDTVHATQHQPLTEMQEFEEESAKHKVHANNTGNNQWKSLYKCSSRSSQIIASPP